MILAFTSPARRQAVVLRFETFEDELTLEKKLEARAVDMDTHVPVASLPLKEMERWLKAQGFQWLKGSSGIWERERAA